MDELMMTVFTLTCSYLSSCLQLPRKHADIRLHDVINDMCIDSFILMYH